MQKPEKTRDGNMDAEDTDRRPTCKERHIVRCGRVSGPRGKGGVPLMRASKAKWREWARCMVDEIGKVVTPTVAQWAGWCLAATVFALLLMMLVTGTDFGLGRLTLRVFG